MVKLPARWLQWWGRKYSLASWADRTQHPLLIVLYHHVGPELPYLRWLYHSRTSAQFETDLQVFQQFFTPLSLSDVYAHATGEKPITSPSIHITFDDGLTGFQDHAWPLLQQYGFPASVFVNPDFITGPDMLYRMKVSALIDALKQGTIPGTVELSMYEHLKGRVTGKTTLQQLRNVTYQQRHLLDELGSLARLDWTEYKQGHQIYLSANDLQSMAAKGLGIGAHSLDHPLLAVLPEADQLMQVKESVAWVQQRFAGQPPVFAFPFTDHGLSLGNLQRLQQQSETDLLLLGTAGIKREKHRMHFQRYAMDANLGDAVGQLQQAYAAARIKQLLGRYEVAR